MTLPYVYTPYIWPVVAAVLILAVLGIYGIRHRSAPGAIPFAVLMAVGVLWLLSNVLQLVAAHNWVRVFWFKFEWSLYPFVASLALCFVLEYAGLGRYLTRQALAFMAIVPVAAVVLILTSEAHDLLWRRIWFDGRIHAQPGVMLWVFVIYGYILSLLHLTVLVWLFVRSPRHRLAAAGLIVGLLVLRAAFLLDFQGWNPFYPLNAKIIALNLTALLYAVAAFQFQLFDVTPIARDAFVEAIADGVLVLNQEDRIADLNPAARRLLGIENARIINSSISEVLRNYPELLELCSGSGKKQCELALGSGDGPWCRVHLSPVVDRRGFRFGRLIWFHDITEQKKTQARLLDSERTRIMLEEREILARELHDGIGQVAAGAHMHAKAASQFLAAGKLSSVKTNLELLASATRAMQEMVRSYLLGVNSLSVDGGLIATVRSYVNKYHRDYGVDVELVVPPELEGNGTLSSVHVQLQYILQEALTNVRKHSGAREVLIVFALDADHIVMTVEDRGCGFEFTKANNGDGFGLRAMRGRAEIIGASLEVNSMPGQGTRIVVRAPSSREES